MSSTLAEGLLKAIKAESDGYHFYTMAARSTEDPKGREIFQKLALEEQDHMRFLTSQYRAVLDRGRVNPEEKLGRRMELAQAHPIFSSEIKSRVREAHFEMTALSIAIKLELDAMNYYRSEAVTHDDPEVKKFYTQLADWEAGHYTALVREHDALKEDYWSGGGFSPF